MKRISVDTNIVVRLLVRDDVEQWHIVRRLLDECHWVISTTVVLETEWVLRSRYGLDRSTFCTILEGLIELENVDLQERDRVVAAINAHRKGMGFADALHLTATVDGTSFTTFDSNLIKHAKQHFTDIGVELAQ